MADHYEPNYAAVLEQIAERLGRVATALETVAHPDRATARWYEAAWRLGGGSGGMRSALEAYSAADALVAIRGGRGGPSDDRHVTISPLRPEQCKWCCDIDWAEDGRHCKTCGYDEKTATEKVRAERAHR